MNYTEAIAVIVGVMLFLWASAVLASRSGPMIQTALFI
jgi:hypothetical protein